MSTFTQTYRGVQGDRKVVKGLFTFTNPYVVGGEALTAAALGLSEVESVDVSNADDGKATFYVESTDKIKLFVTYAAESTAVDQSARSCRVVATGY